MTQETLTNTTVLSALISALTSIVVFSLGLFGVWLKKRWESRATQKQLLTDRKRETFQSLLDLHAKIFFDVNIRHQREGYELQESYFKSITGVLIWSSDEVLVQYARYAEELRGKETLEFKPRELYFARAVLAYREELRYKNKGVTPENIATIFKAIWKTGTI